MVDIDPALAKKSASDLADGGVDVRLEVGDVAEPEVADAAARLAVETWGRIDILINNAGIGGINRNSWELPVEEMDQVYRTNLRGVYVFCGAIIPHMLERDYGRIVNIASVAGKEGNPRAAPYSATKAGVIAFTKSAGKELAGTGVRVNCVTPAVVETRLLDEFTPEQVQYMLDRVPMGRFVEIDEIAALVAWLSSSECSFSTGAVFDITGGRSTY
jgi:3-oxoacyl-[acyl-carrier protein] reductase